MTAGSQSCCFVPFSAKFQSHPRKRTLLFSLLCCLALFCFFLRSLTLQFDNNTCSPSCAQQWKTRTQTNGKWRHETWYTRYRHNSTTVQTRACMHCKLRQMPRKAAVGIQHLVQLRCLHVCYYPRLNQNKVICGVSNDCIKSQSSNCEEP